MDNVQNCDGCINIHRHKPIDLILLVYVLCQARGEL
jgi:hypothetical protein